MKKIKEMLETIEKYGDEIKIEEQFKYVFNNENEDLEEMVEEAEKENLKAQHLEGDFIYFNELKEKYEDEMIKYFKENLAEKRLEEMKKRIAERGYTYFEVETEEIGGNDICSEYMSGDFEEIIKKYAKALHGAEVELRNGAPKRVKLVRLIAYVSEDQEEFDDDNMETLISQEVRRIY